MIPMTIDSRVRVIERRDDGYAAQYKHMYIIASLERKSDGHIWLHVSLSCKGRRMPTYDDLKKTKELTFGPGRVAVQIFPTADRHIDIAGRRPHPVEVLHLWGRYSDNDWLPDMADGGNSI